MFGRNGFTRLMEFLIGQSNTAASGDQVWSHIVVYNSHLSVMYFRMVFSNHVNLILIVCNNYNYTIHISNFNWWGYRVGSPTAVRPSDPALCGSRPLVTPYFCRLGDLLCLFCVYPFMCLLLYVYMRDLVVFVLCFFLCRSSFSTLILLVGSFDL